MQKFEKHNAKLNAKKDAMEAETRKQRVSLFDFSWEHACQYLLQYFVVLCAFSDDHESTVSVDFGVTNKF